MDYNEAQKTALSWVDEAKALARQNWNGPIVDHDKSPIVTGADVLHTVELRVPSTTDGAIIQFAVEESSSEQGFAPIIIVTELAVRKHETGISHTNIYRVTSDGKPSFKKLVKNAVDRGIQLSQATGVVGQTKKVAQDADARMAAELQGLRVPPEFLLERLTDGNYALHVATMKISLPQLKSLIAAIWG
jgi:hypothetical protein